MKLKLLLMAFGLLYIGNSLAIVPVGPNSLSSELDTFNNVLDALQRGNVPQGFNDSKSAFDRAQSILNNLLTNGEVNQAIYSKAYFRTLLVNKGFYDESDMNLTGQEALSEFNRKLRVKQTALNSVTPPAQPIAPVEQGISATEAKALREEIARLQRNEQALREQIVEGSSSERELKLKQQIKDLEKASQSKISSDRETQLEARIKELEEMVAKLSAGGVAPIAIGGLTGAETAKVETLDIDSKRTVKALLADLEIIKKANLKGVGTAVVDLEKYTLATIRELLSNQSSLAKNKLSALKTVSNYLLKIARPKKEGGDYMEGLNITIAAKSGGIFDKFKALGAKKADPAVALMQSVEQAVNRLSADATQENMAKTFKNVKARAVKQYYLADVKQLVEYFNQFKKESTEKIDEAKLIALNKITESLVDALDSAKSASAVFEYTKLFNFNEAGNAAVSRKGSIFDEYLKIGKAEAEAPQVGGGQAPEAPMAPGAPEVPGAPVAPAAPEEPMV